VVMKKKPDVKETLPREVLEGYRLGVDGWSFPEEKLKETLEDGTRKLLTLDVGISPEKYVEIVNEPYKLENQQEIANEFYKMICPNNCSGCFEKGDLRNDLLGFDEVKNYLEEALELGLESIKFLGPGELITNPDLFKILDYLQEKNIKIGIFTKGGILGDDKLAMEYQGLNSEDLVAELSGYDVTRFLVDCRTFDEEKANRSTHSTSENYAQARNRTIELLVENGMNSDLFCQRMSLQTNPVKRDNIDEVLEIFQWGTERNIPVIVTPTMISGRGRRLVRGSQQEEFQEKLIQLYTDIYAFLIDRGIMTYRQLQDEGVSSYAGTAPCNQLSSGMYIRKDGVVQRCPGNDLWPFIVAQDIREQPLREIWVNSRNYKMGPRFNNQCVKDGYSIPRDIYIEVLKRLK
tara:strand:+ start:493 stop:1707 length:1215 start_codon:yes stop_codon:yes gene_type:complete